MTVKECRQMLKLPANERLLKRKTEQAQEPLKKLFCTKKRERAHRK